MFVRATTVEADPARIDDGVAFVRDHVVPAVATMYGSLGLSMFVDRDTGLTTVSTGWATEQGRTDADETLSVLRGKVARILGGSTPVTELLELVALDRLRPAMPGFWNRSTQVTIDAAHLDEAIDAYTSSITHDLQLLPGYCSASLLVDRRNGRGMVSIVFDSRATLDASREMGEQIRRTATEKTGATAVDVRESEIVIAGLRLPQTG